jgi:sodium/potassium/calcium exchanger 6
VKANCHDEDAGFIPYLTLYYCHISDAKPVAFGLILIWLGLLFSTIGIAASDFFCINLSTISTLLGLSESLAGVTFLAFGNGSPDVFSTFAAMGSNSGSLAVGELIGAAGFITSVVAGSMAFVRPFKVAKKSFIRDIGFFIVATGFSLFFLYDGKLHLWESVAMVALYIFYVIFVVTWHWLLTRRRKRRLIEAAARSQYIIPGSGAEELGDEYHDEDEDRDPRERPPLSRTMTGEDFDALERVALDGDEDDELEDLRDRWLAEISRSMRLSRPRPRERRNTQNPIRPSLVGALEFRSVLSGLQKSRNIQSYSLHVRRYSDDPTLSASQGQRTNNLDQHTNSQNFREPDAALHSRTSVVRRTASLNRMRAASAVEPHNLRHSDINQPVNIPKIDLLAPLPDEGSPQPSVGSVSAAVERTVMAPPPSISISPPPSNLASQGPGPIAHLTSSPTMLTPPDGIPYGRQTEAAATTPPSNERMLTQELPTLTISSPSNQQTNGGSPFPVYADGSSHAIPSMPRSQSPRILPQVISPDHRLQRELGIEEQTERPLTWWPYRILPPPLFLLSSLFPTLYSWKEKNYWEKLLGIVAAPSVFLLTITLPVVETERDDITEEDVPELSLPGTTFSSIGTRTVSRPVSAPGDTPETHNDQAALPVHGPEPFGEAFAKATVERGTNAVVPEQGPYFQVPSYEPLDNTMTDSPEQLPVQNPVSGADDWNRWLVILQIFTAPLFMVLILWANTNIDKPRWLLRGSLISLVCSLVVLAFILTFTTSERAPKWRSGLCFLGFMVSVAWISTIAGEVVGVLKALGVILDISDAILGLTVFAVGNSLGDLVADVTVAKLGYPVMALSACFGGPMLNILLGIGLSGMYMTIRGAHERHQRHPGKKMEFKPFHIDVDRTLMVSGAALLVTLVGLLIVVPLRSWRMDRAIGWGLVILWSVSTVGNVGLEFWGGTG